MTPLSPTGTRHGLVDPAIRGLTAVGLVIDAGVHLQLASQYQLAAPGGVGQGTLFRLEAVVALLAAVYVLVRGSRLSYAVSFVVAASALAAVLLYRYVDIGSLGPIPSMYEPLWFTKKVLTAIAEAEAAVFAVMGLARHVQSTSHR